MAPSRKLRSLNKRNYHTKDVSPEKDGSSSSRSILRKKKLSDKLGRQWMKDELQIFYDAYRKYGRDWRKVASAVSNRSIEMVESLYNMNKAYLSLPEGTASVVGLIAMMTDHYNVLGGSDTEQDHDDDDDDDDDLDSCKSQKRKRGKVHLSTSNEDPLVSPSVSSADGCLSILKSRLFDGYWPRAVGKRTPRVPVSYLRAEDEMVYNDSPYKKSRTSEGDANYDEVAHIAALTLTEAHQRNGFSQVPESLYMMAKSTTSSPAQSTRHTQSGKHRAKLPSSSVDKEFWEDNRRVMDAGNGENAKDSISLMSMEDARIVDINLRGKKVYGKKKKNEYNDRSLNDVGEVFMGTSVRPGKGKVEIEALDVQSDQLSPRVQRKKSKNKFSGDESTGLDALQTLADLSLLMPMSTIKAESSIKVKEESTTSFEVENKTKVPQHASESYFNDKVKLSGAKKKSLVSTSGFEDTVKKSKLRRDLKTETVSEAKERIQVPDKMWKSKCKSLVSKAKAPDNYCAPMRIEAKSQVDSKSVNKADERYLPTNQGRRSKSKMDRQKKISTKELKYSDNQPKKLHNKHSTAMEDRALSLKEKLSYCLSSSMVRKWCTFEWFYSAIDYPWFAKKEFVEYLDHVGLEEIPRLTRVEWGVIRSSLGKPRRFSEHFLQEERDKLKGYRESVRKHYSELRNGIKEGLPTDLARPLSVGQRVIALHPKTREVHEGCILTVDHDKCRVQFDRPEIGVEFVMDIDCMPLNPLDNVPEALRLRIIAINKVAHKRKELETNGHLIGEGFEMSASSRQSETTFSYNSTNWLVKQAGGNHAVSPVHEASFRQPCMMKHIQAKEADIRVCPETAVAPDKKVSSAIFNSTRYNTYLGNPLPPWLKRQGNSKFVGSSPCTSDVSQESGCSVVEIVQGSRLKAQVMVNAAIQALSLRKEGEDPFMNIGEALDSISNRQLPYEEQLGDNNQLFSGISCNTDIVGDSKSCQDSDKNDSLIPSELITSCVATLLMIQTCTERQYPPADVAQILDSAVTSLNPCCSQNQPFYREIQMCMGRIKTQILALIPT